MTSPEERISTLVELGLSQSQAKVYSALLETNKLTAKTISQISRISRPDVYRLLAELIKAGLVQKTISEPDKFEAMPPDESILGLLQNRVKKTEELQEKALKLVHFLKGLTPQEEPDNAARFVLFSGRASLYAKAEKMITKTQKSIDLLSLTRRILTWFSTNSDIVEDALNRNVHLRIIIPKRDEKLFHSLGEIEKNQNFSLRLLPEQPTTAFSIWDKKEILLTTSAVDSSNPVPQLWSNNKSIVGLCQGYFEYLWLKSKKREPA